jgi:hypothetical protein
VANAHITKARRVCWAVSMKISSGCCKQELGDFLHFRSRYLSGTHSLGFTAPAWSRTAGCEPYCSKYDYQMSHSSLRVLTAWVGYCFLANLAAD